MRFVEVPKKVLNSLIFVLKNDEDKDVRADAASALSNDKRALPALITALNDNSEEVLVSIVNSLRLIRDKRATPALLFLLQQQNQSDFLKQQIIDVLGHIKDKRAINTLIFQLKFPKLRASAIEALGEIKDKKAIQAIVKYIKDDAVAVRINTLIAFGKIAEGTKDKRAFDAIAKFIKDEDVFIRINAVVILGRIADNRRAKPLIRALKDKNENVRMLSALALGEIKDKRALRALTDALKYDNDAVGRCAAFSLNKIKTPISIASPARSKNIRPPFGYFICADSKGVKYERIERLFVNNRPTVLLLKKRNSIYSKELEGVDGLQNAVAYYKAKNYTRAKRECESIINACPTDCLERCAGGLFIINNNCPPTGCLKGWAWGLLCLLPDKYLGNLIYRAYGEISIIGPNGRYQYVRITGFLPQFTVETTLVHSIIEEDINLGEKVEVSFYDSGITKIRKRK